MRLALSLWVALLFALAAPASAQDRRAGEITEYEFVDGDLVEGGRYTPLGEIVPGTRRRARRTLIQPRAHFIPEMLQSVERL